eukprot:TRINITY_DN5178_c0_g1_i8.p1 TRINITY_DN5178_c0_g1~~TRINITY_DN5178_c0_g1_i8.p1  ORF type:complete len:160 (-),score=1.19 TRINITY_DN5178_c0_g1_i8:905-1384(-)
MEKCVLGIESLQVLGHVVSNGKISPVPDKCRASRIQRAQNRERDCNFSRDGAVLSQIQGGMECVIAYASRTLNRHERNYGVTQLRDQKFRVITDHRALVKFPTISGNNPQLERWSVRLADYDFEVQYKPGKTNTMADAMSRHLIENINLVTDIDDWIKA